MTKSRQHSARKPATKFAKLRMKMRKRKAEAKRLRARKK